MLLLNLDIIFTDDSNSKVNKEVHGINGADMVARFMFSPARRYGLVFFTVN